MKAITVLILLITSLSAYSAPGDCKLTDSLGVDISTFDWPIMVDCYPVAMHIWDMDSMHTPWNDGVRIPHEDYINIGGDPVIYNPNLPLSDRIISYKTALGAASAIAGVLNAEVLEGACDFYAGTGDNAFPNSKYSYFFVEGADGPAFATQYAVGSVYYASQDVPTNDSLELFAKGLTYIAEDIEYTCYMGFVLLPSLGSSYTLPLLIE